MENVKISVVLPVYNVAPYLRQCMDSIINQTLKEIEIICVDDGSTDDSSNILDQYAIADGRVKVYHCEHTDAGTSRNFGLDRASGDYIQFVDADDCCDLAMLEKLYGAATENNADIVVCAARSYSEKTQKTLKRMPTIQYRLLPKTEDGCFSYRDCPEHIFQLFSCWAWDRLIKLSLLKDNQIRAQSTAIASTFSVAAESLVRAERIFVIRDVLYTQRRDRADSILSQLDESWDCCYQVSKRLHDKLREWGLYDTLRVSYQRIALQNCCWLFARLSANIRSQEMLYNFLKTEAFEELDLTARSDMRITNPQNRVLYETIMACSYTEYLFNQLQTARKDIKVSVVVPVYNVAPYLRECLDSLTRQTLREIEIICVDDGSTDNSLEILNEYAALDERVKAYHLEHSNAGNCRDYGMDRASGEFIIFIDADDYCELQMLKMMYDTAIAKFADIVVCEVRSYSEKTKTATKKMPTIQYRLLPETEDGCFSYQDCPEDIFQLFVSWTWDKLIKLSLLKDNQIRGQSLPAANSFALVCEALVKADRICTLKRVLYTQRRDQENSITSRLEDAWDCCYKASKRLMDTLVAWGMYDELKVSYQRIALHNCCWYVNKLNNNVSVQEKLYDYLRNEAFEALDLTYHSEMDIANTRDLGLYELIKSCTYAEYLFNQLQKQRAQNRRVNGILYDMERSASYRVGRKITYIPRKTRDYIAAHRFTAAAIRQSRALRRLPNKAGTKICIVAYEYFHYFILQNTIKLADYRHNYVEVYTNIQAYEQIAGVLEDPELIHWHVQDRPAAKNQDIKKLMVEAWKARSYRDIVKKSYLDKIILISPEYTITEYEYIFRNHSPKVTLVAMIHNLNSLFRSPADKKLHEIIRCADAYAVLSDELKVEIEANELTDKPVFIYPFLFQPEQYARRDPEQKLHFVIAGHIEKKRKDYDLVTEVFAKLQKHYDRLKLSLIGSQSGEYANVIGRRCDKLREKGLEVSITGQLSEADCEKKMMSATCFLSPVEMGNYSHASAEEVYGVTKATGAVLDMVRYAKPAILPAALHIPDNLRSSALFYSTPEEFKAHILSFLDLETCAKIQDEAYRNSLEYSLEKYHI